jgi:hypothetical protein
MIDRALIANASLPYPANLLNSDEQALWWDRPDPSRYARQQAGRAVVIGLFFGAIGAFSLVKAVEGRSYFAVLFCSCFMAIGAYVASDPIRRYFQAKRITYLLTDKRAVVADERVVKSIWLRSIKSIEITQTVGGFADVLFFDRLVEGSESDALVRDGFIGIAGAETVAGEMRRLQAAAS